MSRKKTTISHRETIRKILWKFVPVELNSPWISAGDHRCIGCDSHFKIYAQHFIRLHGTVSCLARRFSSVVFACVFVYLLLFIPSNFFFGNFSIFGFISVSMFCSFFPFLRGRCQLSVILHPNMVSVITITIVRERIRNDVFFAWFLVWSCVSMCMCMLDVDVLLCWL